CGDQSARECREIRRERRTGPARPAWRADRGARPRTGDRRGRSGAGVRPVLPLRHRPWPARIRARAGDRPPDRARARWHGDRRGLQNLSGDPLTSLGRLTGLVSADLLLLQVLLMARIPWAERSYGQDELARRHRLVGFGSVTLMLAHIGLISLGYAVTDHSGLVGEVWSLVTTYPGMLLATAGTLALILVAATSIRAARRKLRYESWHLLHLYGYL